MMNTTIPNTRHAGPVGLASSILPYVLACVVFSALPLFGFAHDTPFGVQRECGDLKAPPLENAVFPAALPMGMTMLPPPLAHLDLSDEQQERMFRLMQEQARPLFENQKIEQKTLQELQQLANSSRFDSARARSLSEAHGKALAELAYLHTVIQAQVWTKLSDEQRKLVSGRMAHPRK